MRPLLSSVLMLASATGAMAQVVPIATVDDTRLQTLSYDPSQIARLVAFPGTNLTLMLLPGDMIERIVISDRAAFDVHATASNDSLNIMPLRPDASATMIVETGQRRYEFDVQTGTGVAAAYVVRLLPGSPAAPMPRPTAPVRPAPETPMIGSYRVSGERALRPARISDDGERTYIEWGEYQSLPAVFGIGPTGGEEVVDGYMRDGRFTIDRVYAALVFRVDKKHANARRREKRSAG